MHTVEIEEFKEFLNKHYSSPNTVKAYIRDVREFVNFNKEFSIESVERFVSDLFNRGASEKTIVRKLASLSVFFEFLKSKGLIEKNIVKFIDKPKVKKQLPKFLDVDETLSLLDSVKNRRDRALLELIYSSGLRVGEVIGLDVEDVDFSNLRLRIKRKGGKIMFVPFSERAAGFLKRYIGERSCGPLFLNRYGERLSERMVHKIVKKYAISSIFKDISPHTLRHSRATHLLNNGMDIRLLQKFLGHSSIRATQVYTHLNLREIAVTYDKTHPLAKDE